MKLNNRGWGMREMIIYMCILILFLLFASYSVNTLYANLELNKSTNDTNSTSESEQFVDFNYYRDLEYKLSNATFNYLANVYSASNDDLDNKVDVELLKEYDMIDTLYDQFGTNICKGYSKFYKNEKGAFVVNSYISCNNYETEGY